MRLLMAFVLSSGLVLTAGCSKAKISHNNDSKKSDDRRGVNKKREHEKDKAALKCPAFLLIGLLTHAT